MLKLFQGSLELDTLFVQADVGFTCRSRHAYDITVISPMRFQFDEAKSRKVQQKHGVSLEEAQEIFDQVHIIDRKNDDPEQFRAIGWCRDKLCSVIFEIRRDPEGEYYRLITAWKATKQEEDAYADQV